MIKYILNKIVRNRGNVLIAMAILFSAMMLGVSGAYNLGVQGQVMNLMRYGYTGDMTILNRSVTLSQSPNPIHVKWNQTLADESGYLELLKSQSGAKDVLRRLSVYATVMGEDESKNEYSMVMFVEYSKEKDYLFDQLLEFDAKRDFHSGEALVSEKLARKLDLKPGDDIYFFFIKESGFPVPVKRKVGALFQGKGYPALVESMIFLDYAQSAATLKLDAPLFTNANIIWEDDYAGEGAALISPESFPDSWRFALPQESGSFFYGIHGVIDFFNNGGNIILLIVVFAFAFSIFLMNINKQKKAINIMNSLGISHGEITRLYLLEGFLLAFVPALAGIVLSLAAVFIVNLSGIPAFNETMRYIFASDVLYLQYDLSAVVYALVAIPMLSVAASFLVLRKFLQAQNLNTI